MPTPTTRSRRPRPAVLLLVAALAAGVPAADAGARPRITLAPSCYLGGDAGRLTGAGFRPDATWTARLGGRRVIGRGTTDGKGRIRARFTAPRYRGTRGTREVTLSVSDGSRVATTTFRLSPLSASFSPRSGNPASLRVRWRVLGLGPRRGVYVHYLDPKGRHRRTVRIGTSDRVCGALKTGPIALFPFRWSYGTWTLQIDGARRFSPRTRPRLEITFAITREGASLAATRRRAAPRG